MYHVYSTMANSTRYVKYRQAPQKDLNIGETSVLINGGSGINKRHIATPLGLHTGVSEADMEWLKDDPHFKQHIALGYIVVRKQDVNPEVAAADMVTHDRRTDACPIVPQEFKEDGDRETIKPVTSKKKVA